MTRGINNLKIKIKIKKKIGATRGTFLTLLTPY